MFFNSTWIRSYGISPVLQGLLNRKSVELGLNFPVELVGSFGDERAPNLGLVDCHRGREIGFASYVAIRKELFGENVTSYDDINPDKNVQRILKSIYGDDLASMDLFVGGLAEPHIYDGAVGKTFRTIFLRQLDNVMYRDGICAC